MRIWAASLSMLVLVLAGCGSTGDDAGGADEPEASTLATLTLPEFVVDMDQADCPVTGTDGRYGGPGIVEVTFMVDSEEAERWSEVFNAAPLRCMDSAFELFGQMEFTDQQLSGLGREPTTDELQTAALGVDIESSFLSQDNKFRLDRSVQDGLGGAVFFKLTDLGNEPLS